MNPTDVVISADSHVMEPLDLWKTRLPGAMRDQAPAIVQTESSKNKPPSKGLGGVEGGRDPQTRTREMEVDGVAAEVLYPTYGLRWFALTDVALQEACFRVYNDWLVEYCSVAPKRLIGLGCVSPYDMSHAVAELKRCRDIGLRGVMIWQSPPEHLPFTSEHYEPLWAAAADLGMPVSLHITSGFHNAIRPGSTLGVNRTRASTIDRTVDVISAVFDFIFTGILQRHPALKIVIVENEIGWLPFMLQQWDAYCMKHKAFLDSPIDEVASFYFRRQVFATFFEDPVGARNLDMWGADNCMWSSDYPHRFSTWPHSREAMQRQFGHLTAGDQRKVACDNVAGLYGISVPDLAPAAAAAAKSITAG